MARYRIIYPVDDTELYSWYAMPQTDGLPVIETKLRGLVYGSMHDKSSEEGSSDFVEYAYEKFNKLMDAYYKESENLWKRSMAELYMESLDNDEDYEFPEYYGNTHFICVLGHWVYSTDDAFAKGDESFSEYNSIKDRLFSLICFDINRFNTQQDEYHGSVMAYIEDELNLIFDREEGLFSNLYDFFTYKYIANNPKGLNDG